MTGVILVMEPSLESCRMHSNRVFLSSLAASAAIFGVLSLPAAAVGSTAGLIDLSYADAQDYPGGTQGGDRQGSDSFVLAGVAFAQNDTPVDDIPVGGGASPGESSAGTGSTTDPDPAEDAEAAPAEAAGREFSGSSAPSGPDLDRTAEQELISAGWK